MYMLQWASRCLPGFSIIALLLLLLAFTSNTLSLSLSPWTGFLPPKKPPPAAGEGDENVTLNLAQKIFMVYTLFVHTNMLAFAARLSLSLWYVTRETKRVLSRRVCLSSSPAREMPDPVAKFGDSTVSEMVGEEAEAEEVVHAIILPNYGEDLYTLITTLNVLASHPRAHSQYEVSHLTGGPPLSYSPN